MIAFDKYNSPLIKGDFVFLEKDKDSLIDPDVIKYNYQYCTDKVIRPKGRYYKIHSIKGDITGLKSPYLRSESSASFINITNSIYADFSANIFFGNKSSFFTKIDIDFFEMYQWVLNEE
jgi:hypothetical protein